MDEPIARTLQRIVGEALAGHSSTLALSVLVGEMARVLVATGLDGAELRPVTALMVQQLQQAVSIGVAARKPQP